MVEPFDVWVCTCNSEKLLPLALKRIEKVIPSGAIKRKFVVDDFSSDNTKEVAEKLGWPVYSNKKKGLFNAQRLAFSLVETDYCASFEHDLYLSRDWFPLIPKHVMELRCDVAQGIRIRDVKGFRELDIYDNNHRVITSADNTFFSMTQGNKETLIEHVDKGSCGHLRWYVDKTVCSRHIRGDIGNSLRHDYLISRAVNREKLSKPLRCLLKAPLLSLKVVKETRDISVIILYPLERFMILSGAIAKKVVE
jgi:glycosyltransferase involved in cell wall biosynthesis